MATHVHNQSDVFGNNLEKDFGLRLPCIEIIHLMQKSKRGFGKGKKCKKTQIKTFQGP
jgi:hypothetical protein